MPTPPQLEDLRVKETSPQTKFLCARNSLKEMATPSVLLPGKFHDGGAWGPRSVGSRSRARLRASLSLPVTAGMLRRLGGKRRTRPARPETRSSPGGEMAALRRDPARPRSLAGCSHGARNAVRRRHVRSARPSGRRGARPSSRAEVRGGSAATSARVLAASVAAGGGPHCWAAQAGRAPSAWFHSREALRG